jgi:2-haloacid dehalogenase
MARNRREYPQWADIFDLYTERWDETLGGSHEDTVAILHELKAGGTPLYALSNWSAEMFPHAEAKYDWLALFDGIVVSGRVGMIKPERDIFDYLLATYDLRADDLLFVDDHEPNVLAARTYGIAAHHFQGAAGLRAVLEAEGLL